MNTQTIETTKLEVRRVFPATRERLYQAWTNPAEARHWFGGGSAKINHIQMDVTPGGRYAISVTGCGSDEEMLVTGEYREVTPPERLVYTWRWEDDEAWAGVDSLVTVDFVEHAEGSEVVITHERFPTAESRGRHEHGWGISLDALAKLLSA